MPETNEQKMADFLAATPGLFSFGGQGGSFSSLGDVGGQMISFWGGSQLDAIQIGSTKYGGNGGAQTTPVQIPADGKVYLKELHANGTLLCYIHIEVGGTQITCGTKAAIILAAPGLPVSIAGVCHGSRVDSLIFNLL